MSEINFCNTKEQLNHLGEVVTGKVDGSPSGADIDTSTLPYTGQVRKTLPALEAEYIEAIRAAGGEALSGGVWAAGQTFTAYNQFMVYNDTPYKPLTTTTLPYGPTGATPDIAFVGPFVELTESKAIEIAEDTSRTLSGVTYKASGGNSAVDNMIAGVPVAAETDDLVKCENGSEFKRIAVTGSLSDFEPVGEVYLADFGDDTQAFQDAANCGSLTLNLPESIAITGQVVLPPNLSLVSKAVKAVIDATGITTPNINAIVQSGSVANSTTLISDVTDESITITVSDPAGFEPGKVIFIRSTLDNSWSGTWGAANRAYRKKSSFIIIGVSGNIILLDTETNTTFEMASTVVEVLNPTTAKHKNFLLKGPDGNQSRGMQVQYGHGTIFEDVDTDGFEITGLENLNCRSTKYIRPKGNIRAAAVNTQYTIAVSGSDLTEIVDGDLTSTRHAVAIVGNDQCRRTTVKKSILKGSFPADAHGNADEYTYEECEIYSTSGGLKVGGRNGSWIRNKVYSESATIVAGIEIYGGTFRIYDNEFHSPSGSTFGAGWSPIDLGRGTAAITTDSRQDMLFKFYDNNVDLPGNIGSFYARMQNNSPYKVDVKFRSEIVKYPTAIDSFFRYEGTPTGGDANFATFDDIFFDTTAPSLPLIKRGTGATGYDTSKVVSADYSALSS